MTISELRKKFISGEYTPMEAVAEAKAVISEKDGDIHAYLDVYDDAEEMAKEATARYQKEGGNTPPLCGVPLAIKNNILIAGKRATGASKILDNYIASYDATVIKRLRDAGAIFIGSTNMDEFAMGSSTENSAYGPTRNPIDQSRVPGGSSGGSAAAVAMSSVPAALGTDTGGSIRQPASYCGLVGLKPTYGAVSRYGLMAMGSSLDQAGTLTNSVEDAETLFNVIAGRDPHDMTTISGETYGVAPTKDTYTFGVPRAFLGQGVDADVMERFESHLDELRAAGHRIVDIELPLFEAGLAAYYIVMPAEVSSNLARFDGIRYGVRKEGKDLLETYLNSRADGFGAEAKRRILLGTYVLSSGYFDAYYGKAEALRGKMRDELNAAFAQVDLVVTPTAPTPAFKLGEKSDPLSMYRQDIFTVPVNLTGVPALSIPMGEVERDGVSLPTGVQYIAPHGGEARLFDIGRKVYDAKRYNNG
ncbi:glutaminyl-tRNA synthase (glutamine-hydrolyzing) subunit A [Candidatus Kaiserbacteria bacterium RIFOXYB1_FULL_46_14]|uniref:Glutamyl-tRNA(Gln) amidotransferase subunit A n=1 Tax=Candidatus Kaiserbacteria bacterium RIFOXYB1_FULL_46_14 TaxID=1798531 RepID=A0A1F6FJ10_9BACT|nr:MAG: glutaminyl-tRNA synthase (glutamine-hydrolyzing) subunit A [Candidatus Kaiserbacteria bacterium RIFOXYB1_FULL_46_14]